MMKMNIERYGVKAKASRDRAYSCISDYCPGSSLRMGFWIARCSREDTTSFASCESDTSTC